MWLSGLVLYLVCRSCSRLAHATILELGIKKHLSCSLLAPGTRKSSEPCSTNDPADCEGRLAEPLVVFEMRNHVSEGVIECLINLGAVRDYRRI